MSRNALLLMTRTPEPGFTKTRMMPDLSAQECAELHQCLLADAGQLCRDLSDMCDAFVAFAPAGATHEAAVRAALDLQHATCFVQDGASMGERMRNAVSRVFDAGYDRCALLGADSPELRAADVRDALGKLDEADVVIGPANDGGFYLMALKAPSPELFALESYGHERVFEQTLELARLAGLRCVQLRNASDLDCVHDARALLDRASRDERLAGLHSVAYLRDKL